VQQHAVAALSASGMVVVDDADREDDDLLVAPSWSWTGWWPVSQGTAAGSSASR
jgi:hypothetical protein